jgi:SAM-dependent methyltransferase
MEDTVCITDLMRRGHPYLEESVEILIARIQERAKRLGRPARIFEIGCASGMLTQRIAALLPDADIVAQEELPLFAEHARRRLRDCAVTIYTRPLQTWERPVDIFYSAGTHHHLPHEYLGHVRRLLAPGGIYLVDDEFCPEYCRAEHAERVARGDILQIESGYVFTSARELAAFRRDGKVPEHVAELERRRQQALWRWYRFVVDYAMEHGSTAVASAELRSASDDLVSGSEAEHKFSPAIVERQFAMAGFRQLSKQMIGPANDVERQSFFVYELGVADR